MASACHRSYDIKGLLLQRASKKAWCVSSWLSYKASQAAGQPDKQTATEGMLKDPQLHNACFLSQVLTAPKAPSPAYKCRHNSGVWAATGPVSRAAMSDQPREWPAPPPRLPQCPQGHQPPCSTQWRVVVRGQTPCRM